MLGLQTPALSNRLSPGNVALSRQEGALFLGKQLVAPQHLPVPPVQDGGDDWELPPCRAAPLGQLQGSGSGTRVSRTRATKSWMMCVLTVLKDQGLGFAADPFP